MTGPQAPPLPRGLPTVELRVPRWKGGVTRSGGRSAAPSVLSADGLAPSAAGPDGTLLAAWGLGVRGAGQSPPAPGTDGCQASSA